MRSPRPPAAAARVAPTAESVREVAIRPGGIALGQFLKFAEFADSGGMAKALLADGVVQVNGEVETRRGRRLAGGDIVGVDGDDVRIVER